MKRLNFYCWLLAGCALLAACQGKKQTPEAGETPPEKPNIVLILADDLGYGDVSVLNPESKARTPHLDALAQSGMNFTDAHSTSGVCTPTRYALLTGRYSWRTRLKQGVVWGYDSALIAPERLTMASLLKQQGYRTACLGKWHLGMDYATTDGRPMRYNHQESTHNINWQGEISNGPLSNGFDEFFGIPASLDMHPFVYVENNRFTEAATATKKWMRAGPAGPDFEAVDVLPELTRRAVEYIGQSSAGQPFFLYMPLPAPHTPVVPTPEFAGQTAHPYLDFCRQVDHTVGQVVQALKDKGLLENTLLVFTSDNGFAPYVDKDGSVTATGHRPSHIFRGFKADIWEGGHRVPFFVHWPGKVAPGSVNTTPVSQVDLLATFAGATGAEVPENAGEDSQSLLPLLQGEQPEAEREAFVMHSVSGQFAIRKGDWKMLMVPGSGGWSSPVAGKDDVSALPPFQLYNLATDPGEQQNLYEQKPEKAAELKALLQRLIRQGHTVPGKTGQNDPYQGEWPQIDWMESGV